MLYCFLKEVNMRKRAFTMVELLIVIVVVGILAVTIVPRLESDPLRQAVDQVVRHIAYTQHMAMVNDIYRTDTPIWFKAMWRISFRVKNCYLVSSNSDLDMNYDREESVMDPLTRVLLYSNSKCRKESTDSSIMFLEDTFDIDKIVFEPACGDNRFIAFDNFGRPHRSLKRLDDYLKSDCLIMFYSKGRKGVITIRPETGYVTSYVEPE